MSDQPTSFSDRHNERAIEHLRAAIRTAEQAIEDAKHSLSKYDRKPMSAATAVLHTLAWGHANATASIEIAMSHIEDAHVVRLVETKDELQSAATAKAAKEDGRG